MCFTAASKMCCVVYIGLFTGPVNQWSSSARQIFKEYFHSLVQILKHNFHTESETERLNSDFEVLVCEYAQIGFFREPCKFVYLKIELIFVNQSRHASLCLFCVFAHGRNQISCICRGQVNILDSCVCVCLGTVLPPQSCVSTQLCQGLEEGCQKARQ